MPRKLKTRRTVANRNRIALNDVDIRDNAIEIMALEPAHRTVTDAIRTATARYLAELRRAAAKGQAK